VVASTRRSASRALRAGDGVRPPVARLEPVEQAAQNRLVEGERALGVGLGQRAAADRAEAQVVGVVGVAGEGRHELAQRGDPGELGVDQGDELAPRGQGAHPVIGAGALGEALEAPPRHRFAEVVEEGIVMLHGRVPMCCLNIWLITLKPAQNLAMRHPLPTLNRTAVDRARA